MIQASKSSQEQLAKWIYKLVEILRLQNNSTWRTLVRTVSGKRAIIRLDDISLQLEASHNLPIEVSINYPVETQSYNFISDSETMVDIIAGKITLDQALATNRIYLRGTLIDLRGISQLVKEILADSAINSQLQTLWKEFQERWNYSSSTSYYSLDNQQTNYNQLISIIPEDVLKININI
ncbi:MAG: hypothetical protein QNJ64_11940 [Crocosphaera sp.]|nr:hypothetical protein [Crocosphaera sp.]